MQITRRLSRITAALLGALAATTTFAADAPKLKMTTAIPEEITTPDSVETRLGTLNFFDGFPDEATITKVYDNLDFQRGVQAFLTCVPGASEAAIRAGIRSFGPDNQTVVVFENLMDSKSLFLTANTESVYAWSWLNVKDGPMVLETPPNVLGVIDDFWFRNVTDFGLVGPDKGKGGKYLILPPGYTGKIPKGYIVAHSPTFNNLFFWRGSLVNGDPKPAVDSFKKTVKVYPLGKDARASKVTFVNGSGKEMNTIHANNYKFYEEISELVQEEPTSAMDVETLGMLAAIGIVKGKPFAPDARQQKILADAAVTGELMAKANTYGKRFEDAYWPGTHWKATIPVADVTTQRAVNYEQLDERASYFYEAVVLSPAMKSTVSGFGQRYFGTYQDKDGGWLTGGNNYHLHVPANPPAAQFWSVTVYDEKNRQMLVNETKRFDVSSRGEGVVKNADGSTDVYVGPTAPKGLENNWIQTKPGEGWFPLFRFYGPTEKLFDKTWVVGDFEKVK
jgi:hypothetical protein